MAALITTLILSALTLDIGRCGERVDLRTLEQQLRIDTGEFVQVEVRLRCDEGTAMSVEVEAHDGRHVVVDELTLPALSAEGRARVLALIILERLHRPAPLTPTPVVESRPVRRPLNVPTLEPVAATQAVAAPTLHRPLVAVAGDAPPSNWRLGLTATAITPLWLWSWRVGGALAVEYGALSLSFSGSFGTLAVTDGTVSYYSVTAEPELTVLCVMRASWQLCATAKGIVGYGAIHALPAIAGSTVTRTDGPVLGGAGKLSLTLPLGERFVLDLGALAGGTWAVYATDRARPVASLGGGFVQLVIGSFLPWGS